MSTKTIPHWRVVLPVGLGTGLSLAGDSSLYTVLPTHLAEAGVTLAAVGVILSANRFIRLALNGPAGWLYDRSSRRWIFVLSLFIGALSTAIYALTRGFVPLLAGRLLWGLAWAGIWVGGNTMMFDISTASNRGRRVGVYQAAFFLGSAAGAISGGLLTDWLGYHGAMGVAAGLTLLGALFAAFTLPETRTQKLPVPIVSDPSQAGKASKPVHSQRSDSIELVAALGLLGLNRLALAGVLPATLGLFLLDRVGERIVLAGQTFGVASLTGFGLGASTLLAMSTVPLVGALSDRAASRWQVVAGGLLPGALGFVFLATGSPWGLLAGLLLTAVSSGSNASLSTTLVGDLSPEGRASRRLGLLFTVGDFASAIGPPLAIALIPLIGLNQIYILVAALFALMVLLSLMLALIQIQAGRLRG